MHSYFMLYNYEFETKVVNVIILPRNGTSLCFFFKFKFNKQLLTICQTYKDMTNTVKSLPKTKTSHSSVYTFTTSYPSG